MKKLHVSEIALIYYLDGLKVGFLSFEDAKDFVTTHTKLNPFRVIKGTSKFGIAQVPQSGKMWLKDDQGNDYLGMVEII